MTSLQRLGLVESLLWISLMLIGAAASAALHYFGHVGWLAVIPFAISLFMKEKCYDWAVSLLTGQS